MRSSWIRLGPKSNDQREKRRKHRLTQRRWPWEDGSRDQSDAATSQGHHELRATREAERGLGESSSWGPPEATSPAHTCISDLWPPGCRSKPPRLWQCAAVASGNDYTLKVQFKGPQHLPEDPQVRRNGSSSDISIRALWITHVRSRLPCTNTRSSFRPQLSEAVARHTASSSWVSAQPQACGPACHWQTHE